MFPNPFKTIRARLMAIFTVFTFITALVSVFCFLIYEQRERISHTRSTILDISDNIRSLNKLQCEFILYDSKNNSFYQTRQSEYIIEYRSLYLDIVKDLKILCASDQRVVAGRQLRYLIQALDDYNQDFEALISKIQQRGFWDNGLEGSMRDYIHQLESYRGFKDMALLLTIRRNEKDYILRKNPSYIVRHNQNTARLRDRIANTHGLQEADKEALTTLLDNYQQAFHDWIVIDREIGTDQGGGLTEQLKRHNKYFERIINTIVYASNQAEKKLNSETRLLFVLAIVISITLSVLLSFVFSNLFTRPIRLLSDSIAKVVSENFSTSVHIPSIKSQHEIAMLVRSFNRMIEQIHAHIEQVRANEKKLNASEQKFRALIENSSDGIALTDKDGVMVYAGPSTCSITGYTPDELVGRDILELVHPEDFFTIRERLWDILTESGKRTFIQFRLLHKEGFWIWIDGHASNFLEDVDIRAVIINYRDITNRKQNEVMISEQYVELQRVNSELDRFVYSASHDLKAPLSSILGMVTVARREMNEDNKELYLNMIQSSAKKLLNIIKELTNFSRNARIEVLNEPINVGRIVKDTLELYSHLDNFPLISFETTIDEHRVFYSDPLRLKTILNNLIANAIIYHDKDKERMYIAISVKLSEDSAEIRVADNGRGIDPEDQPKIFDMFFRASEDSLGSGLGLYIVKNAVKKLRGDIQLCSEVRAGTEFIITLPDSAEKGDIQSDVSRRMAKQAEEMV